MSDEGELSEDYQTNESTEIRIPEKAEDIEETKIDDFIYGKNKPRRMTINRKVIYDENK